MPELGNLFAGSSNGTINPIFMIILLVGMVALFIIPQRRREKKAKEMLSALKVGDPVRTIGGFYGTITNIKDDVFTISCGPDKVKLTISRNAIADKDTSNKGDAVDIPPLAE